MDRGPESGVSFVFVGVLAGANAGTGSPTAVMSGAGWRRDLQGNVDVSCPYTVTDGLFPHGFQYVHHVEKR